jgi:sugar lactone lactonase YvrE
LALVFFLAVLVLAHATPAAAQSTTADVVYGQGGSFTTNTPDNGGISANSLDLPYGVAQDSSGNLYVADFNDNRVLFYPSGSTTATRVYGQGGSFTTNTQNNGGLSANSLGSPSGVALDSSGNLYVADSGNNRVLFYPSGSTTATRVYGQGGSFTTNTPNNGGLSANSLGSPSGVALDSSGNLYVADDGNNRVLFYPSGSTTATRVYGQGGSFTTNTQNNGGLSANSLGSPSRVALDSSGNLYVADSGNNRVLFYPSGSTTATQVYGQGGSFTSSTSNNGGVSANSLYLPTGASLDSSGNLYVADSDNQRVLLYPPTTTPGIYGPVNQSTLTGNSVTFWWVGYPGATAYWVDIGSTMGGNNYYSSGNLGIVYSTTVSGLPTNGSTVYVTLYYLMNGSWTPNHYTYTAFNAGAETAVMMSPTPSSMLSGSTAMFNWNAGTASPQEYWLDIGSSAGGNNYYSSGNLGNALSATVSGLPTNGTTVYVTLYTLVSGTWTPNSYTYTASSQGVLTTPTPGSTFTSSTVTFDWRAGSPGPYSYWLDIGNSAGGNNYYSSGNLGTVTTTTVSGLPTTGGTVYVTLYTLIGGSWYGNAYTYTALNATSGLAAMQSPTPGSTLSGTTATFTWSSDANATAYWVDIGSSAGGNNIYSSGNLGTALSTTVYTLPANGTTIYVSLYSYVGGQWVNNPVTYTSGP